MELALLALLNRALSWPGGALWVAMGTRQATAIYVVFALVLVLWRPATRRLLLPAMLAVALTDLSVNFVWKPVFGRARPCAEHTELLTRPLDAPRRCGADPSFPSSHAATTAALAAATGNPVLVVVSVVVGTQRMVTAQHYPSDVAFGWLYGAIIGVGVRWWRRRVVEAPAQEGV